MQKQLEKTLFHLVSIPSVSADAKACRAIIEYLQAELASLGLHLRSDIERDNPWLLATTRPTEHPKVLLLAHLDVVPATKSNHFTVQKEGEKLFARGIYDMKFAAACFVEFLKSYQDEWNKLNLGVLFTTDEEIGGESVKELLADGFRSDIAIIPDADNPWAIEQKAKGLYTTRLYAKGESAHGSRPWKGENAIGKLIPVLHELQQVYPSYDPQAPSLSINIIGGGLAMNQVPVDAEATLDFRAFKKEEVESYKQLLEKQTATHGLDFELLYVGDPLILDKTNPLVQDFFICFEELIGPVNFNDAYGGTDGRHFARYNIPCIITSIRGGEFHGANEWIHRDDLLKFYQLIEQFILREAEVDREIKPAFLDAAAAKVHTA